MRIVHSLMFAIYNYRYIPVNPTSDDIIYHTYRVYTYAHPILLFDIK